MIVERNFKIKVNKDDFYSSYLSVMNGILNLTNKERDVLSWFMEREYFYNTEAINKNVFDKTNRKLAAAQLEVSPHYLNNYIKSLKEKKMIVKGKKGLGLNSSVYLDKNDGIRIKFEIESLG
jgi:hypothetical protein